MISSTSKAPPRFPNRNQTAVVVGCLPAFAVFLKSRRLNTSNNQNIQSKITVNTCITIASSPAKGKARTESVLLEDFAESTRHLDKNKASFVRSRQHISLRSYGSIKSAPMCTISFYTVPQVCTENILSYFCLSERHVGKLREPLPSTSTLRILLTGECHIFVSIWCN